MVTLYGAPELDSGPHISLPFLVDLPLLLEVYKIILQPFFGPNPKITMLSIAHILVSL